MEKVTQTSPTTFPSITDWEINVLYLGWREQRIHIDIISNTDVRKSHEYLGQDAKNKMIALNKANLSIKSLYRRIYEFLVADGIIEGVITGSPD